MELKAVPDLGVSLPISEKKAGKKLQELPVSS
jgi:hypothetical protein